MNGKNNVAVVDKYLTPARNIGERPLVVKRNNLPPTRYMLVGQKYRLSFAEPNTHAIAETTYAQPVPSQILQGFDVAAHVSGNPAEKLQPPAVVGMRPMGKIKSRHVHARLDHPAQRRRIAARRSYRADNAGLAAFVLTMGLVARH